MKRQATFTSEEEIRKKIGSFGTKDENIKQLPSLLSNTSSDPYNGQEFNADRRK